MVMISEEWELLLKLNIYWELEISQQFHDIDITTMISQVRKLRLWGLDHFGEGGGKMQCGN